MLSTSTTPVCSPVFEAELGQHPQDVGALFGAVRMSAVANMHDEVCRNDLLQSRTERRDQIVRQVRYEAHSVREDDALAGRQDDAPHGWIEGREELVARVCAGPGQPVEERRFSGICVSDQGDHRIGDALPRRAMQAAGALDCVQRALETADAGANLAPVGLDLRFAWSAYETEAAALALKVRPGPYQTAALVAKSGELDLEPALPRARPCAEDFEDKGGTVDDFAAPRAFEIALLNRGERPINDDQLQGVRGCCLRDRFHPPETEQGRRPRLLQAHDLRKYDIEGRSHGRGLPPRRGGLQARAPARTREAPPADAPAPDAGHRYAMAN